MWGIALPIAGSTQRTNFVITTGKVCEAMSFSIGAELYFTGPTGTEA